MTAVERAIDAFFRFIGLSLWTPVNVLLIALATALSAAVVYLVYKRHDDVEKENAEIKAAKDKVERDYQNRLDAMERAHAVRLDVVERAHSTRIAAVEKELGECRTGRNKDSRHNRAMIQMISESFGIMRSMTGGPHNRQPPQDLLDLESRAKRLLTDVIMDNGV